MQLTVYPNNEIRFVWGAIGAVRPCDSVDRKGVNPPLLDIPPQPSQAKARADYKRRPLSKKARHTILHHGGLFRDEDRERQCFLTGTLPGSTDESMEAFKGLAPAVVKMVQTYLPRMLRQSARDIQYLWVWELQKRGALHMHIIVECETSEIAKECIDKWSDTWKNILEAVDNKVGVDLFERASGGSWKGAREVWQVDASPVKKSVSRYLSKYSSKGSEGESKYFPPRWYGISSALRRRMKHWLGEKTMHKWAQMAPEMSVASARVICEEILREFCLGEVKHKHGYGDRGGVDCFGYLKEGVKLASVRDWMFGMLGQLGAFRKGNYFKVEKTMVERKTARLARRIERAMPADVYQEFVLMVTPIIWSRMESNSQGSELDLSESYWSFKSLMNLKGYTFLNIPGWASVCEEEFAVTRQAIDGPIVLPDVSE